MVGLDRSGSFSYLVERVVNRLKGWKENLLALGGRKLFSRLLSNLSRCMKWLFSKSQRKCVKKLWMQWLPLGRGIQRREKNALAILVEDVLTER